MGNTPFREVLALIIFDGDFDFPQHPLARFADRRTEGRDGVRGIEIENAQKVLMFKIFVGFQPAAGQNRVGGADGGRFLKRCFHVELIIALQKTAVNGVKDFVEIVVCVLRREPSGDALKLVAEVFFCGDAEGVREGLRYRRFMLRFEFPQERAAGFLVSPGVRNVEHIAQAGAAAGVVNQGDAARAALDPPAHPLVPEAVFRAGRRFGPLGVNHKLLVVRVFVEPGGGFQKIRPAFVAGGDLLCGFL
ncbi:MAG: hypothetical protein LKJ21_04110, partial [Oscillospiraceae bacterium]|nr:hypothetical protein [Oscillospiraceae bacterium]